MNQLILIAAFSSLVANSLDANVTQKPVSNREELRGEKERAWFESAFKDMNSATLEKIVESSSSAYAWEAASMVYLQRREYVDMLRSALRAMKLDPTSAIPYVAASSATFLLQDYVNAIKFGENAIHIAPYEPSVYNNVGEIYRALGMDNEAILYFEHALLLNPNFNKAKQSIHELQSNESNDKLKIKY